MLQELLLKGMKLVRFGDALYSHNVFALRFSSQHQAGVDQHAIKDNAASATVAVVAAFLSAGQSEFVSQDLQEALAWLTKEVHIFAVDTGLYM